MKSYVFRSLPKKRDSRTIRYQHIINDSSVHINTWEDSYEKSKRIGIERLKIGRNEFSKVISYPAYLFYLFLFSMKNIKKGDRVICMDLDTFIPVLLGSLMKKAIIYLDIVDPISQTKFSSFPFPRVFDYIEYFFLSIRKFNILPNDNRVQYYRDVLGVKGKAKYILVENVPISIEDNGNEKVTNCDIYDIGYFGTLDSSRGLLELLNFSKRFNFRVLFAGMGSLEPEIVIAQEKNSNISFYGAYGSEELSGLYSKVKFSWAYYTDKELLHKYASPNKFYEHLAFKTPMITNEIVPMSRFVNEFDTGLVISNDLTNDTFFLLADKIKKFNSEKSDYSIWSKLYSRYSVDFLDYEK